MRRIYDCTLNDVFAGVLRKESLILGMIDQYSGNAKIENNVFLFSLPALYELTLFVFKQKYKLDSCEFEQRYIEYRGLLYKNPTNEKLKEMGGFIETHSVNKDHSLSIYKLRSWPLVSAN